MERFGMSHCKPAQIPLDSEIILYDIEDDENINNPAFLYRALLDSLMYLAQGTRPDISYAVNVLSQFNTRYNKTHWVYAKRILRYLKRTINCGLNYTRRMLENASLDLLTPIGTAALWIVDHLLSNATISWESRKQKTVIFSSTEAEYVALSDTAKEVIYLSRFLSEIDLTLLSRVRLYNDNQGAGKLAMNPVFHSRSKHVDIRYHFIR